MYIGRIPSMNISDRHWDAEPYTHGGIQACPCGKISTTPSHANGILYFAFSLSEFQKILGICDLRWPINITPTFSFAKFWSPIFFSDELNRCTVSIVRNFCVSVGNFYQLSVIVKVIVFTIKAIHRFTHTVFWDQKLCGQKYKMHYIQSDFLLLVKKMAWKMLNN